MLFLNEFWQETCFQDIRNTNIEHVCFYVCSLDPYNEQRFTKTGWLRWLIARSVEIDRKILMDVSTAYLNAEIDQKIDGEIPDFLKNIAKSIVRKKEDKTRDVKIWKEKKIK